MWDVGRVVRKLPPQTGDLAELRALEEQLSLVRQELELTKGNPAVVLPSPPAAAMFGVVLLGFACVGGLVAALSALVSGESPRLLGAGVLVALASAGAGFVLWRAKVRPTMSRQSLHAREAKQHHRAVLDRNAVLWEQLRPEPAPDLPLPPDRQPTRYALSLHARSGRGPAPEAALRALPPDASRLRVWWLSHVGRSVLVPWLVVALVLALGLARLVAALTG